MMGLKPKANYVGHVAERVPQCVHELVCFAHRAECRWHGYGLSFDVVGPLSVFITIRCISLGPVLHNTRPGLLLC